MPRKTDTRERLLEVAMATIAAHGEAAVRVAEVADAVGVTKPSVYHYFGDREGLIVAALAESYRRMLDVGMPFLRERAEAARTRDDYRQMIDETVRSFAGDDGVRRRALRMNVFGAAVNRPRLQEALIAVDRAQAHNLAEIVRIGRAKGFGGAHFDDRLIGLMTLAIISGRHYAEIDDEADLEAWDAMTIELLQFLSLA